MKDTHSLCHTPKSSIDPGIGNKESIHRGVGFAKRVSLLEHILGLLRTNNARIFFASNNKVTECKSPVNSGSREQHDAMSDFTPSTLNSCTSGFLLPPKSKITTCFRQGMAAEGVSDISATAFPRLICTNVIC